jgi:hypothetical protein
MTEDDYDIFVNKVAAVLEGKGKRLTEVGIGVWWTALSSYDLDTVTDAIDRYVQSGDGIYSFTTNHVVELIEGNTVDASQEAWAKMDKAVRQAGPWADVIFDDPIIHRVIEDMGGWAGFGQKTDKEWAFVAKEFETRYRGYKHRSNLGDYLPRLTGTANTHNNEAGYMAQEPVLIGDLRKIAAVMGGGSGKAKIGFNRAGAELMALLPQLAAKPLAAPKKPNAIEIPFIQQGLLA